MPGALANFLKLIFGRHSLPHASFLNRKPSGKNDLRQPVSPGALYVGLIVAQGVYVYQFFVELRHLIHVALHKPADVPDIGTFIPVCDLLPLFPIPVPTV